MWGEFFNHFGVSSRESFRTWEQIKAEQRARRLWKPVWPRWQEKHSLSDLINMFGWYDSSEKPRNGEGALDSKIRKLRADKRLTSAEKQIMNSIIQEYGDILHQTKSKLRSFIFQDYHAEAVKHLWENAKNIIKRVQLKVWFSKTESDGLYGFDTFMRVVKFQKENGLTPDGILTQELASQIISGERGWASWDIWNPLEEFWNFLSWIWNSIESQESVQEWTVDDYIFPTINPFKRLNKSWWNRIEKWNIDIKSNFFSVYDIPDRYGECAIKFLRESKEVKVKDPIVFVDWSEVKPWSPFTKAVYLKDWKWREVRVWTGWWWFVHERDARSSDGKTILWMYKFTNAVLAETVHWDASRTWTKYVTGARVESRKWEDNGWRWLHGTISLSKWCVTMRDEDVREIAQAVKDNGRGYMYVSWTPFSSSEYKEALQDRNRRKAAQRKKSS